MEERRPYKAKVAGSRPAAPTTGNAKVDLRELPSSTWGEFSEIRVAGDCATRIVNWREPDLLLAIDAAANTLVADKPKGDS